MDEQLEQQIERGGAEAQIEEVLSPAGEEAAEETAEAAAGPEAEINTESSAEETKIPDAELSASGEEDNTSPTADAVQQAGNVARQVARRDLPRQGRASPHPSALRAAS